MHFSELFKLQKNTFAKRDGIVVRLKKDFDMAMEYQMWHVINLNCIIPCKILAIVRSNVKGTEIHFNERLLCFTGNSSLLSITVINKKFDPTLNIDRMKSKKEILAHVQTLNLETNGTLKCLKSSLAKHQGNVKKMYKKIIGIQL